MCWLTQKPVIGPFDGETPARSLPSDVTKNSSTVGDRAPELPIVSVIASEHGQDLCCQMSSIFEAMTGCTVHWGTYARMACSWHQKIHHPHLQKEICVSVLAEMDICQAKQS